MGKRGEGGTRISLADYKPFSSLSSSKHSREDNATIDRGEVTNYLLCLGGNCIVQKGTTNLIVSHCLA